MKISEWISNSGDYDQGLLLYAKYKRHNRTALRLLQAKRTPKNYAKLKYLLGKVPKDVEAPIHIEVEGASIYHPKRTENVNFKFDLPEPRQYRPLHLKDLPKELHPLYIKQKSDYPTACSLKIQLNALAPEQEQEALDLVIKIERLFDSIEKAWQIFDHYKEHNIILNVEAKDYSKTSPVDLYKSEKSKRQLIAKAKTRINVLQQSLEQTTDQAKKTKLSRQIESKNEARIKHEMELEQIREFISKK